MTDYLTVIEVLAIHEDQIERYGGALVRHASLHERLITAFKRYTPAYKGEVVVTADEESRHRVAAPTGEHAMIFDTTGWRIRVLGRSAPPAGDESGPDMLEPSL